MIDISRVVINAIIWSVLTYLSFKKVSIQDPRCYFMCLDMALIVIFFIWHVVT